MNDSRGILILALGHPYYGRMAHNLAVSIKAVDPLMPVALVHAGNALNHFVPASTKVFDEMILAPVDSYTKDGQVHYVKSKTWIYDLTPFVTTLYLDADTLWLPGKKPRDLFDELKALQFTMANHEHFPIDSNKTVWAKISDVKNAFGFTEGKYFNYSAEFIYFTKCAANSKFFHTAKKIWDEPRVQMKGFANSIPDEYAFSVASILCNHYPHQSPYHPSYWFAANRQTPSRKELCDNYYLLSLGRNIIPERIRNLYDQLSQYSFNQLKLGTPWRCKSKRQFLPERLTA